VLLGERAEMRGGALHVEFRECAFATLVWLRTRPPADQRLLNVFGAAAVVSRDGAALLGRMAPHTANAGQIYFPSGTPDLSDVTGRRVGVEGSIARELAEETGLRPPAVRPTARAFVARVGRTVAFVRRFDCDLDAEALETLVRGTLRAQPEPELDDIVLVRSTGDLPSGTAPYARVVLPTLLADAAIVD
jgi:8-oxo-dGTP pyrophosphatase MutT (NUDIX family)